MPLADRSGDSRPWQARRPAPGRADQLGLPRAQRSRAPIARQARRRSRPKGSGCRTPCSASSSPARGPSLCAHPKPARRADKAFRVVGSCRNARRVARRCSCAVAFREVDGRTRGVAVARADGVRGRLDGMAGVAGLAHPLRPAGRCASGRRGCGCAAGRSHGGCAAGRAEPGFHAIGKAGFDACRRAAQRRCGCAACRSGRHPVPGSACRSSAAACAGGQAMPCAGA